MIRLFCSHQNYRPFNEVPRQLYSQSLYGFQHFSLSQHSARTSTFCSFCVGNYFLTQRVHFASDFKCLLKAKTSSSTSRSLYPKLEEGKTVIGLVKG